MNIFTIGYEGLDVLSFVALLLENNVQKVVDIRELPLSRKPGFSKRALAQTLADSGLDYEHMVKLGCPKPVRDQYKTDGSWRQYTKGFLRHLHNQAPAIEELAAVASRSSCALLCFEADYRFCHRSFVADAVSDVSGAKVRHLIARNVRTASPALSLRLA